MIVKVIYSDTGGFGHSFQGAVRYVASTPAESASDDRIDFVATRNLPSDNPEVCWRLMASHALHRKELMRQAGIALRGSGKGEVAHIVLSWSDDERSGLTKTEMLRAADGALRYLKLDGNQCFMAAHNDTDENPHLHLVASRVDLQTGKLVSAWRSHRALSKWALSYERSRGEVLIKQRERAWAARDNGITPPKAKKTTSKDQYELEKAVKRLYEARRRVTLVRRQTDDPRRRAELRATGRGLRVYYLAAVRASAERIALAKRNAVQRQRHARQGELLAQHHRHRRLQITEQAGDQKRRAKRRIENAVASRHARFDREHAEELRRFYRNETSRIGRLYNQLAYTDWKEVFRLRQLSGERGPSILSRAFTALSDVGHRRATIDTRHRERVARLYDDAKRMQQRRESRIDALVGRRLTAARVRYGRSLRLFDRLQAQSAARLKSDWGEFNAVRRGVTTSAREACERTRDLKPAPSPAEAARRKFKARVDDQGDSGGSESAGAAPKRVRRERKPRGSRRGP
ncbi:Relaxase/Mobilization nuclease domain protein [Botrimarina colliarenosi]|uniref:Relaxase/Mobilization nuclease domain protein n=1 Tax=Botrimarina colliarenosi TaxID=2528001 RepID=A0A5C6AK91_9BACT|nr:relaxase/mobilization nuclease domain-containing protein [Botrimarina colliarenosi]TWU00465.1 Relaxase/Mobilization nuclease domain protein [Botrimarina colliarenosi]